MMKLFMVLVTVTVACLGWITGQIKERDFMILVLLLASATLLTFFILNLHEHREQARKRKEREADSRKDPDVSKGNAKRSDGSFALREKKAGLTWGGGNIKASEATRGTKRKFLGK
ncbi:MAG: hypothetical protein ABFS38_17645 [Bacteroidota bacterium]